MAKKSTLKARKSKSTSSVPFTIGIDLGGTKVAAAAVHSKTAEVISEARRPTVPPFLADMDPREFSVFEPTKKQVKEHIQYVVTAMADAVEECLENSVKVPSLLEVGLASAGPMRLAEGTLVDPANFKGWKTVPLVALLSDALKARKIKNKVYFQNDAIAAALGEGWSGNAKGCSTYAMITVGTGIGAGVIFNGLPAQSRGMGSEWGHTFSNAPGWMKDPDSALAREVEGIASGTGIIRQAKIRGLNFTDVAQVAKAADEGNKDALSLFEGASESLAGLFYTLSMGFAPEMFCVSGGMLAVKQHFLPQAIELYRSAIKQTFPDFLTPVKVSKLGTKAGVIGAARLPLLKKS